MVLSVILTSLTVVAEYNGEGAVACSTATSDVVHPTKVLPPHIELPSGSVGAVVIFAPSVTSVSGPPAVYVAPLTNHVILFLI